MTSRIVTLGYYGGKSAVNAGSGRWVASMLPQDTRVTYVEPFCGMLGVLIQRPISKVEIVNDLNERIVNWFQCVRDYPDELGHKIHYSPQAQADFDWAVANLDNKDLTPIDRARALYLVVNFSIMHGDENAHIGWRWKLSSGSPPNLRWEEVAHLSERLRGVQIHCKDGVDVIERVADLPETVIYCDPPYPSSYRAVYKHPDIDQERLSDVLRQVKGQVAISGYGDEWDALGWQRHEFATTTNKWRGRKDGLVHKPRTEVLWTNYEPARLLI